MSETPDTISLIFSILDKARLPLSDEKDLQKTIAGLFHQNGVDFEREYVLDKKNRVDFFVDGCIAIEVKIKGSAKSAYRQCERYCEFDEVKHLVLLTNRSSGFPKEINGKPCYFKNLGSGWL